MRVLHVSLGVPPLRTGGMTRYCVELAEAQRDQGDEVSLLFPGRFLPGKTRIKKSGWKGITTYEVINPLPVALVYGIGEPDRFTAPCNNVAAYTELIESVKPDAIHVHAFQGIHLEFFQEANRLHVPVLYTTHDYYPICPRCTLINSEGRECTEGPSPERCAACNLGKGMSYKKSLIMQSGLYARFKESKLVLALGNRAKKEMSGKPTDGEQKSQLEIGKEDARAFERVLAYNRLIFGCFDLNLSNSSVTEEIYRAYYPNAPYERMPITHAGLERKEPKARAIPEDRPLRIGYFGGSKVYKGIDTLAAASQILYDEGVQVEFVLYGDDFARAPKIYGATVGGRVPPDEIPGILAGLDAVVVPSTYHETFGFVVLEALCAGTLTICSDVIGAKDLLNPRCIFKSGDSCDLARKITECLCNTEMSVQLPQSYPLSMEEQASTAKDNYLIAQSIRHRQKECRLAD